MKLLKYSWLFAIIVLIASCSKKDTVIEPINEIEGLSLVKAFTNSNHTVNLYTTNGKLSTGYNEIFFQITNPDGSLVNNAIATWLPVMHMHSMSHSCPASVVAKKSGASATYGGYIVFQMAGNDMEYWELTINYTINGIDYSVTEKIKVTAAPKRVVESFQGSDGKRYIIALVQPTAPKVALNDISAVLYQMENMNKFIAVNNYTIKIDPRMPGMGNHGSPNNVDLTQANDKLYHGKLSLTMTGYWKINMQLLNNTGALLKGEAVTTERESSSIYFETEF